MVIFRHRKNVLESGFSDPNPGRSAAETEKVQKAHFSDTLKKGLKTVIFSVFYHIWSQKNHNVKSRK